MRSVAIDKLEYNADGSIKEVIPTKDGLKQIKHVNPFALNEAETMARSFGGINTEAHEGGRHVSEIRSNCWIQVKGVDFGQGRAKSVTARVASASTGGYIELHLDAPDGPQVGRIAVRNSGGFFNWQDKTSPIRNANGIHDLYFVFRGDVGVLMTFDHWMFLES